MSSKAKASKPDTNPQDDAGNNGEDSERSQRSADKPPTGERVEGVGGNMYTGDKSSRGPTEGAARGVAPADVDSVLRSMPAGKINVGNAERAVSVILGGLILLAVRRKLLLYGGALATAAYLLYRGISGRCRLYTEIGFDTSDVDFSEIDLSQLDPEQFDPRDIMQSDVVQDMADRFQSDDAPKDASKDARKSMRDEVDETTYESFPASDPPSTW